VYTNFYASFRPLAEDICITYSSSSAAGALP